jgi:hypothetical protein
MLRFDLRVVCWLLGSSCWACAGAAPVGSQLRFADAARAGANVDWSKPVVLEFQPGDRLPVALSFSDQAFALVPAAPKLELVAQRRCFVRIDSTGITTSLTGKDFDVKPSAPGKFRFGLAITRAGSQLQVVLTTPRREPVANAP